MEQTSMTLTNRHSGWSDAEAAMLWDAADAAQKGGLPLKQVFEQVAAKTGRRPNSIRNYYYAQVREREGGEAHAARFVPFREDEVDRLVETVLRKKARGQSVRACLQELAQGDRSLMLRYQNKYRAVLRSRPDVIRRAMERLKEEGVECAQPQVKPRTAVSTEEALGQMAASARRSGDSELIQACDVFARLIRGGRDNQPQTDRLNVRLDLYRLALTDRTRAMRRFCEAADALAAVIKDYIVAERAERVERLDAFCDELTGRLGELEGCVTATQAFLNEAEQGGE